MKLITEIKEINTLEKTLLVITLAYALGTFI